MSDKSGRANELVLSREQVRACDEAALERLGICGLVLMENAGLRAAEHVLRLLDEKGSSGVCIVAGLGNNGGDGFVVARQLCNAGVRVAVVVCGARERIKGDALANLAIVERMPVAIRCVSEADGAAAAITECSKGAAVVVDAMLGTGTSGEAREPMRTAIETINGLGKTVVALDIPSGLDCDTGEPMGATVRADSTVTFAAMKKGFGQPGAAEFTGAVTVASIGIDVGLLGNEG